MKGTSALAIAVCITCFFIGYMFYAAAAIFVSYFSETIDPCHNSVEVCSQTVNAPQ